MAMRQLTLICLLAAAAAAGCAGIEPAAATQVPLPLRPAPGERLAMVVPATGVQIYECRAKAGAAGDYEWAFVAPDATLFDARGRRIGRHYAGPHWEAQDGSKVAASVKARADAPSPEAIPWLLLAARPAGGTGGRFGNVASIQRVNTVGGMAPRSGCSQAAAGTQARVNYSADYHFYSR